jgi:membrane fusion protein, multidrug efflux system
MNDLETRTEPQETRSPSRQPPVKEPATRRSPWGSIIGILIVLGLVAGLVWWLKDRAAQPAKHGLNTRSAPMPVGTATVGKGNIRIILSALGTVTPLATVSVYTQISGQLMEVGYKEGQRVAKGDFLAQIDPRPYQAALDQAQGQLLKDQALLAEARVDLARYKTLAAQDSIAKQQYEDQVYVVKQDEGQVKLDEAAVEMATVNLNYCHIVSPVKGRIGLRLVDPGNYVQANTSTALAVITQLEPITVVFVVPEDQLPAVLKRVHEGAKLPVTAYDRSGTTKLGTGALYAIDSQIDPTTGTVKLRAEFDNKDDALFPQQFVNAELEVDELHDTLTMSTSAVQRGAPGTFVYLVKSDGTVAVQPVKLGPIDGQLVAVQSGLSLGDRVVVDGADKLRAGAKVLVRDGSAAGGQPAPSDAAAPAPAKPDAAEKPQQNKQRPSGSDGR